MRFKVVISDRSFNVIDEIQDNVSNLQWEYNRIGGCGSFSFTLPTRFCEETNLGANFNVKIYRWNQSTDAYDLWYQGRIENKIPTVNGTDEVIRISGTGYQSELKDIYVDRDYSSTEISAIVTSILDNDITPNTNITYAGGDITATSFTADTLSFNTDAQNAFETLSDITGSREWGVDKDRKFFFKARSTSVGFRFPMGAKILKWSSDSSYNDIVNQVIVFGDGDPPFTRTVDDTQSQAKFKLRTRTIQNTAVTTNAVADQLGDSVITEFRDVVRRGRLELLDETQIESTIPIPLVNVIPQRRILYSVEKYKTFLYQGLVDYQVNRVLYKVDKAGNMIIQMQLGHLRPSIAENISQLEFQIDQLRQVGV